MMAESDDRISGRRESSSNREGRYGESVVMREERKRRRDLGVADAGAMGNGEGNRDEEGRGADKDPGEWGRLCF